MIYCIKMESINLWHFVYENHELVRKFHIREIKISANAFKDDSRKGIYFNYIL